MSAFVRNRLLEAVIDDRASARDAGADLGREANLHKPAELTGDQAIALGGGQLPHHIRDRR